uniref:protein acetyllysine N-acetyltransferase n=1 Tax=uncultured Thiotrichaceae bacterium TaxID=298394 RepID=A0A6S6UJZ1_9GAMM|nr:MAG: NAD-dependent protein deacetylase of SIR2 family [uncultured Thiotrichaceae bacterium]
MTNIQTSYDETQQLLDFIQQYPRLVILTGAGISLQSGIPTYRDSKGVWMGSAPMQQQDFIRDAAVRQRYWARSFIGRSTIADAQPNAAHFAVAELEQAGFVELLITQNVDNLHQQAGSQKVIDLHGNLRDVHCLDCAARSSRDDLQQRIADMNPQLKGLAAEIRPDGDAILADEHVEQVQIPPCELCGGTLMPEVVFFGGTVPVTRVQYCLDALQRADALLVIGSSLKVYSGYRFCLRAKEWGKPIALINPGQTRADDLAALHLKTDSINLLQTLLAQLQKA